MKFIIFKILFVFSLMCLNKADIPVHCLKSQIVGKWTFKATEPVANKPHERYSIKCGHELPSNEKSSHLSLAYLEVERFANNFEVEFTSDEVFSNGKKGFWTMVYDEGFEFRFNSDSVDYEKYFAFSRYGPNVDNKLSSNWVSYCYETLVGWYNIGNKWGCFYGQKNVANVDNYTNGEAENKQKITEDSLLFMEKKQKNKNNKKDSFLSISKFSRFTELKNSEELFLDANYKDHSKLVERINSANLTWKAKNYKEFDGYSRGELKKMSGSLQITKTMDKKRKIRRKGKGQLTNNLEKSNSNKSNSCPDLNNTTNLKLKDLPEVYDDWEKYMGSPGSQGSCGSCYAMATISMLEARFRIHECEKLLKIYGDQNTSNTSDQLDNLKRFKISLEHVMKCSVYNQGCDGGYSVLVSKFFNEFELYPYECFNEFSGMCHQTECKEKQAYKNLKFTVKDYYYVGGSYGKTNADNLKMELFKNGPVVVSFEPDNVFMNYGDGIMDYDDDAFNRMKIKRPKNSSANKANNGNKPPEWQKVDHSVVLTGWGKEIVNGKEIQYWKLQNSWGEGWGENGSFRMKLGVNLMSLESIGEAGIPMIIESQDESPEKNKKM